MPAAKEKIQLKPFIRKVFTPERRLWALRVLAVLLIAVMAVMTWPAFYEDEWTEPDRAGDYLPMRLHEGDVYVQPFIPIKEGLSELRLSFDPPVELDQPEDLLLRLEIIEPDQTEPVFESTITGLDINPYTTTIVPIDAGDYEPGAKMELHLTVEQLDNQEILSIHTVNVFENRLRVNDQRRGVALAMLLTYTSFNTSGLIAAIVLLLLVLALVFIPLYPIRQIFAKMPVLPILLAPAFQLSILELLNTLNNSIALPRVLIILSYLVLLIFMFFVTMLSKSDRLAIFISGFLVIGLAIANHMKQFFRGDPLYAGDIVSVRMAMESVNQLSYIPTVRFFLAILLIIAYIIIFSHTLNKPLIDRWPIKGGLAAAAVVTMFLFANFILLNDTMMITQFNVARYPWNQMMNYKHNGFVVPFVNSIQEVFISRPNVAEPIPEDFYLAPQQKMEPDPQDPNIIVIMSESYTDFDNIRSINPSEPVMPYFDQLRANKNTYHGNMLAPVFGGGTCNTEFEFLTGGSMLFFHDSSIPYLSYFRKPVHSIPDLLSQQGYTNIAIHPYLRSFWSRQTVYPAMGFDEFISLEDMPETEPLPNFYSDQANFEQIVDRMEEKDDQERLFIFSVTMQNHFPYYSTEESHSKMGYHIKLPEFADAESVELYLNMLRESDDALRYLVTYLETVDEPTLLVFFGDHLPGNNNVFNSFYETLFGKPISELDLNEMRKLYETPYLIWANYQLPEVTFNPLPEDDVPLTSPNFLGLLTLEMAGVEKSPYFEYVDSINDTVKAMSTTMVIMNNGKLYDRDNVPQSIVRQLDRYWSYQYDNVIKPIEPE